MSENRNHLSPGQIMKTAEGDIQEAEAQLHFQGCAECTASMQTWRDTVAHLAPLRDEGTRKGIPCLSDDELAAYVVGEKPAPTVLEHMTTCARCCAIAESAGEQLAGPLPPLRTSSVAWRREMATRFADGESRAIAPAPAGRWPPSRWVAAACIIVAAGGVAWWTVARRSTPELMLARAYTASRPFEFWMPDDGYSIVHQQRGPISQIDRPAPLIEAETAARKMAAAHPDGARALDFKGQVQLLELDYDAAIESLMRASELLPGNVRVITALATAYAARGNGGDLVHAVELYLRAQKLDPENPRIPFNLALVYEKQSMVNEAVAVWQKLLQSGLAGPWRREAQRHMDNLRARQRAKKDADDGVLHDPAKFVARYGSGPPFEVLEYVDAFWSEWLPKSGSSAASTAAALVAARMKQHFGDPSLEFTLSRVQTRHAWAAAELLGSTIIRNRTGQARNVLDSAPHAIQVLDHEGLGAAANRVRVEFAYALRWSAKYEQCLKVTADVERHTPANEGWLMNQARLEHSSCAAGLGRTDEARAHIQLAYDEASRAGLWPVALRAAGFLTAIDGYTGNFGSVWDPAVRGLSTYWATSASVYRAQNFEYDLYRAARLAGWNSAAVVFYRAARESSHLAGNQEMEAWDRFGVAGLLHENGDRAAELDELIGAEKLVSAMNGQSELVENLRWESRLRKAEAITGGQPREALDDLQEIEQTSSRRTVAQQVRLWQARGVALAATSDAAGAAAAFQQAIALNQNQARSIRAWIERIPVLDLAAASYRGLTQIQLESQSDAAAALRTWLEYRTDTRQTSGIAITIALLNRGIAVWRSGEGATTFRWTTEPTDSILRMSETLRRLCSSPASDERQIRSVGGQLYSALLAPELHAIPPGTIQINADSWLAAIPLAALTDDTGAYIARKWWFVESYGAPLARPVIEQPIGPKSRALVVVAPAGQFPGGGQAGFLNAAMPEAQSVMLHFPDGILKESPTAERLQGLVSRTEIFHFVGHGWANGGGGALLLEPSSGTGSFLTARALAAQDWSKCSVAVLSACLTATGMERGTVNNQSLVQALLSGGARRVIAARWSVDSESTSCLMRGFYDALLRGVPAAAALALGAAEVSQRESWRHPYYWAAFDVFGSA
jgi:CHAT domain-containing protein/cytochrome c-type biogenesis protein CcmH/NrfG